MISHNLMSPSGRWTSSIRQFRFLCLISLLFSHFASAKKTEQPTVTPTMAPSITSFPSDYPTDIPTFRPSLQPTEMPSSSSAPSMPETPTPTAAETLAPTKRQTHNPTSLPTKTATIPPTQEVTITNKVRLPTIGIDIVVSDHEGTIKSEEDLETDITNFIEDVLEVNSGVNTFDYVVLNFKVITSSFRRRKLKAGFSIRVDGTAYFGSEPPSSEDLASTLRAYFAVWGMVDLETYLRDAGLPSAQIAAVTIDGEIVKPANGEVGYNAGAKLEQSETEKDEETSMSVIAGLATGCAVLVAVLCFVIMRSRTEKSRSCGCCCSRLRRGASPDGDTKENDVAVGLSSPTTNTTDFVPVSEEDDDNSIGDLSAAMSIYTTDESVAIPYDTKRLDKVIAMARKHSDLIEERVAI